jgi:regulator of nonsense transcripts 3
MKITVSVTGNEYPAVVEFAPFQRLPKKRSGRKKDPKMGTLEQDPVYISFLESKAAKPTEAGSTQHCSLEYFPPPESKSVIGLVHHVVAPQPQIFRCPCLVSYAFH